MDGPGLPEKQTKKHINKSNNIFSHPSCRFTIDVAVLMTSSSLSVAGAAGATTNAPPHAAERQYF